MGRPKLTKSARKERRISFYVNEATGNKLDRAARAFGHETASDWARHLAVSQANTVTGGGR